MVLVQLIEGTSMLTSNNEGADTNLDPFILNVTFDIGTLPVLIVNSQPAGDVLRYIKVQHQQGSSSSTLQTMAFSLRLLYTFWRTNWQTTVVAHNATDFMAGFGIVAQLAPRHSLSDEELEKIQQVTGATWVA